MNIPVDTKVNMSLDDLLKAKKRNQPAKRSKNVNTNKPMAKKSSPIAAVSAARQPRAPKQQNRKNSNTMDIDKPQPQLKQNLKVAQNVGVAKAKRAANVNQRRGLNTTGRATQAEMKNAVKKETVKVLRAPINILKKKQPVARGNNTNAAAAAAAPTLKISFNPGDLKKTTPKDVYAQIQAVLHKSGNVGRNNMQAAMEAPPSRQVSIASRGRK